ncbi:hypothetical protein HGM15179_021591 [Zosterops borbonicus]|uniref:Uncharacterized protein n=1 Tax=Zosterops borbonicus TaxID=364589 RepID=A0A8K1D6H9_9PASS|nr:hypothetical protein HGM15179_021591 [Zosterops borbonicus]
MLPPGCAKSKETMLVIGVKGEPFKVPVIKDVEIESETKICLGNMLLVEEADYNLLGRDDYSSWYKSNCERIPASRPKEEDVRTSTIALLNFLGDKGLKISKSKLQFTEPEDLELRTTTTQNPAQFLFREALEEPTHNCAEVVELQTKIRPDLEEEELEEREKWFVDGSARVVEGKRKSGYAIVDGKSGKVMESGLQCQLVCSGL